MWQVPKHDSVLSGSLTLAITNVGHTRQRWTEGAARPLASLLSKFMIGLVRAALALKTSVRKPSGEGASARRRSDVVVRPGVGGKRRHNGGSSTNARWIDWERAGEGDETDNEEQPE